MDERELSGDEARSLRFLRRLVTVLTVTMIGGVLVVIALLVIRLQVPAPLPALPDAIVLPAGTQAEALSFGRGWVGVVTTDQRFLVFDAESGEMLSETAIRTE